MSNNHILLTAFQDRRTIIPSEMPMDEILQGIYCGFDSRNGEPLYVGLSENIRNRIYQHIQQLNRKSKTKAHWDEDFKFDPSLVEWKLLEVVENRDQLNAREQHWWEFLNKPRLNITEIHSKSFRTGGDTRKRHPGLEELFRMRDSGMTAPEMANALGVTKSSIYGWFRDAKRPLTEFAEKKIANGLRKKTDDFLSDDNNLAMLKSEIASGRSFLAVSEQYGLERKRMQYVLEQHGALGKRTKIFKDQLVQKFPRDIVADMLAKIDQYADQLLQDMGITEDEVDILLTHYDLEIRSKR